MSDFGTLNLVPRTPNPEPRTSNREPRTSNLEPRTSNLEPRTSNLEPRTSNQLVRPRRDVHIEMHRVDDPLALKLHPGAVGHRAWKRDLEFDQRSVVDAIRVLVHQIDEIVAGRQH